jgi:hypothetical protein
MDDTKALALKKFGLPSTVNYSEAVNAFLTRGYTSLAGNTYYNAIRFAEGIVIKEDVGDGYYHSFLNGIKIYSLKDKTLLADRTFHCLFYSRYTVKSIATRMLMDVLREAAEAEGISFNEKKARKTIEKILDSAMNVNQIEMLQKQSQKYLGA